jgi:hypothetical protein
MSKVQEFDYSIDLAEASLLWRHSNAENILALVSKQQESLDALHKNFWEDWYNDVFNLDTANAFGLSVWSIILEVSLSVEPEPDLNPNSNWGFGQFRKNFTNAGFAPSPVIVLNPNQARMVLKLKYYNMIAYPSQTQSNAIMKDVFATNSFVVDNLNMTVTYVFTDEVNLDEKFVLDNFSNLLPRPSTVGFDIDITPQENWGYDNNLNYDNGNYGA